MIASPTKLPSHILADGIEPAFELYPLEKTIKLLAAAKGCTDETTNVKELFSKVVSMPVKVRTSYETAKLIDVLERMLMKGERDLERNVLVLQGVYRPGNRISGVSRSYATYPLMQTQPNAMRVALMGPHLHDLDVAVALPSSAEVGLRLIGRDPYAEWPIGMEYLDDRRDGITSGRDEKRFQRAICAHYCNRITLEDAKEMINIAMNNGRFEWYLQRDHGIVSTDHSSKLVEMRRQTLHVRGLFQKSGSEIFGTAFSELTADVYKNKAYASDNVIYTSGALPDDDEKSARTMFSLGLHTIERKIMRVCTRVAQAMRLIIFSSIFDGLQILHPAVDDWRGMLEAYRAECHDEIYTEFNTNVYLVEKPFYIAGVAHADDDTAAPGLDKSDAEFAHVLNRAYGVVA